MYAIIDTETDQRVATSFDLPMRHVLADGGLAQFDAVGDTRPEHAPRYRLDEVADPAPPALTPGDFQTAIDRHIEAVAAQRSYSSEVSLASYVASSIPQWQAEAMAFVEWRDAVWVYALAELAKVQGGQRETPATTAAFVAELPAIEWPP